MGRGTPSLNPPADAGFRLARGGGSITINADGSITLAPSVGAPTVTLASGQLLLPDGTVSLPSIANTGDPDTGLFWGSDNVISVGTGGAGRLTVAAGDLRLRSTQQFGWASGIPETTAIDTVLVRDAADILAQRRTTNPQTYRIYGTFTDASNFERLDIITTPAATSIQQSQAGTGSAQVLSIGTQGAASFAIFTSGSTRWLVNPGGSLIANADNTVDIGLTGANRPRRFHLAEYQEMSEMTAPGAAPANGGRLFLEDDGGGKTRLMIIFATGAAQQIAIQP